MPTLSRDFIKAALAAAEGPDGVPLARYLVWSAACDAFASVKLHIEGVTEKGKLDNFARRVHGAIRAAAAEQGVLLTSLIVELVDEPGTVLFVSTSGASASAEQRSKLESEGRENTAKGEKAQAAAPPPAQAGAGALPGVRNIIAVGAGKGGVGKSTVAVNLAVALARQGHAVGLMDGDIYGPSLPTLLNLAAHEMVVRERLIEPFLVHGVKAVTIGKMVDPEKPLIWRGPMAHGAFKQLAEQTNWGELDFLIIDLPPGTGDVPLTMAQTLQLAGAVIVCTPQKVAQDDAVRAARMFQQLGVEILGVVENMSEFVAPGGERYDIFGKGGAETMAQRLGLPYLGDIPITMALRRNSDSGNPSANFVPETADGGALPRALESLAKNLESQLALASMRTGRSKPRLTIS